MHFGKLKKGKSLHFVSFPALSQEPNRKLKQEKTVTGTWKLGEVGGLGGIQERDGFDFSWRQ